MPLGGSRLYLLMRVRRRFTLELGRKKIKLGERTLIMGVLNITPDSFSDGGRYFTPARAVRRGIEMARAGADWIDVGGESTRPGAIPVAEAEELRRVLPVIERLHRRLPHVPLSIDTRKAEVAEAALRAGASIVNDVSGLRFDPELARVAGRQGAALVLVHSRGNPATMQRLPFARSAWRSVREGLAGSLRRAKKAGIPPGRIILDPGLGFGKSRRQNYELLAQLGRLRALGAPILVGSSRKSFVQAAVAGEALDGGKLGSTSFLQLAKQAKSESLALDFGDAAAVTAAILAGAHIVRVHNVAAALSARRVADRILASTR